MKAIIEFNLPEENIEYKKFMYLEDMICALNDINELIRSIKKEWINLTVLEITDKMQQILIESKFHEFGC